MTPTPTTEPHPDIQSQKMEGAMNEIPDDMITIAQWILMGHAIGTDLGKERKGRLVEDMARQMTRLVQDERERIASDLFNRPGFMTAESGNGEHFVKITFPSMDEMHGFHAALCTLSQFKSPAHPTSLPVSEEPVT